MSAGRALVYGGRGALGSTIVKSFKDSGWWVASVDMKTSDLADHNILVEGDTWGEQEQFVKKAVAAGLEEDQKLDAVICVAGGWAGGSPQHKDFIKNAELMWRQSVWPASISAAVATSHLKEGGMVVLPGAAPALDGTAGMAGYGMAKAAVHQLTKSLAGDGSGLPENCLSVSILPVTLDTPMNRKWMKNADTSTWTSLDDLTSILLSWAKGEDRPPNGSLVKLNTENSKTSLEFV